MTEFIECLNLRYFIRKFIPRINHIGIRYNLIDCFPNFSQRFAPKISKPEPFLGGKRGNLGNRFEALSMENVFRPNAPVELMHRSVLNSFPGGRGYFYVQKRDKDWLCLSRLRFDTMIVALIENIVINPK